MQATRTQEMLRRLCPPFLIVLAALLAYSNSFSGVFLFDDLAHISYNRQVREGRPAWDTLVSTNRPVVAVSIAANYAAGGLDVRGYHAFNLVVHILAGLTLFGVVARTCSSERVDPRLIRAGPWLALTVALIWVVHPLQTQSVTYVIQRGESMMGLFYLLTLYCVIRGAGSARSLWWYTGAVASCALGMGCKAVMATAPVVVFLYDVVFLSRSPAQALRRRWLLYLALASTWGVLVVTGVVSRVLSTTSEPTKMIGFGFGGITPLEYALTQPGVIVHYLRLALWPDPLCFDYGWPVASTARVIIPPLVFVLLLLGVTLWGFIRRPWLGFVGAWFFLILAPTSSIVPIADILVEHRMYLSLASVILLMVLGADYVCRALLNGNERTRHLASALRVISVILITAVLIGATWRRNEVYSSRRAVWRDVVSTRPGNARAHLNLGVATEDFEEALRAFGDALRIKPDSAEALYNMGKRYAAAGRSDEAIDAYRQAIALSPNLASAHFNLGNVCEHVGRLEDAKEAYRAALEADPEHTGAHVNLGVILASMGDFEEAVRHFRRAVDLSPAWPEPRTNLGRALIAMGKPAQAASELRAALSLFTSGDPAAIVADAYYWLGVALERQDQSVDAMASYAEALRINPDHRRARLALDRAGRPQ